MIERILEIKTNLESLFSLVENEILEQRKLIDDLTQRVSQMENYIQNESLPTTLVEQPQPQEVQVTVVETVEVTAVFEQKESEQDELEQEEDVNPFSLESDEDTLFEIIDVKRDDSRKSIIGDIFSLSSTIGDAVKRENPAWMDDLPGDKIDNMADAVSLNDRMIFVRELFDEDSEQFILTLDRLNEIGSLTEGISYLRAAFPEWDESSDSVYRFYMIVRRRFRS